MEREFKLKLLGIKSDLLMNAEIEYHKRFLELTNLKVGDIVECSFSYNTGDRRKSYICSGVKKGMLKQHPIGKLYVESIDPLPKSKHVTNGRSGRSYRGWYEYENVHVKADINMIKDLESYEKAD